MNWTLFIIVFNRPDLLKRCLDSIKFVHNRVAIIDNSINGFTHSDFPPVREWHRACVPLSFSQSQNWTQALSANDEFILNMHGDSYALDQGVLPEFFSACLLAFAEDPRLGTCFVGSETESGSDVVVAYRRTMLQNVGQWDTWLPMYGSDRDYQIRCELKGWRWRDIPLKSRLHHDGSSAINSDPELYRAVKLADIHKDAYLLSKWNIGGGRQFTRAFG